MYEDRDLREAPVVTAIPGHGKEEVIERLDELIEAAKDTERKTRTDTEIQSEVHELVDAFEELEHVLRGNAIWEFPERRDEKVFS